MGAVRKGLRSFGRFWWDFLVGDTPELFVATVVLVGVAFGLRSDRVAAVVTLPLLAIAMLVASTYRGRRRAPARSGAGSGPGRAPVRRAPVGRRRSTGG